MWKGAGKIIRGIGEYACKEKKTEKKDFYNGQVEEQGGETPSR